MDRTIKVFAELPQVNELAEMLDHAYLPHERVSSAREVIQRARQLLQSGTPTSLDSLISNAEDLLNSSTASPVSPVVNLTGVLLHTGLGRARLAESAVRAMTSAAENYCLTELDLESGERGSRLDPLRKVLFELTGADALVINNCAAAVLLTLQVLVGKKQVILSRGEMIEIGGSFRMPDIVRKAGCKLIEVGCTNKTHLQDYREAITPNTGAILKCHPSNFHVSGFTETVSIDQLRTLGDHLIIEDLGSGCLVDTSRFGLPRERTVQDAVAEADIVMFSGDKLLGGPQAGIILGNRELISKLAKHPLARAMRVDKITIAGLEATLQLYRQGREKEIPLWRDCSKTPDWAAKQCRKMAAAYPGKSTIAMGTATIGGGSLPNAKIPTSTLVISSRRAAQIGKWIRVEKRIIPIVSRGQVMFIPLSATDMEIDWACTALSGVPRELL